MIKKSSLWAYSVAGLLITTMAWADVCFLPQDLCYEGAANVVSQDCSAYTETVDRGEGWNCLQCGGKYKCTERQCPAGYTTSSTCGSGLSATCDGGKSGNKTCCKCEDSAQKCINEGYEFVKTAHNSCHDECPYDSRYYKICTCDGYDETDKGDSCSVYDTCDLGDMAHEEYYTKTSSLRRCTNSAYVTADSPQYTSGENDCSPACTEACEGNKQDYLCTEKDICMIENHPSNPCRGKYLCQGGGRLPQGESTCSCRGVKYYDSCLVEEICPMTTDIAYYNNDRNNTPNYVETYAYFGFYLVKDMCQTVYLENYGYYAECDGRGVDLNGNRPPAQGLKKCGTGADGDGSGRHVVCGKYDFWENCICPTTTDIAYYNNDWINNTANFVETYASLGWYLVKDMCVSTKGDKYGYYAECDGRGVDLNGNRPPAQGLKDCGKDMQGYPTNTLCGKHNWGTACVAKCPYNYTEDARQPDSHCPEGKNFVGKCKDNNVPPILWGECVD